MSQVNEEVAERLRELAALTEVEEGSPQAFRVRAYHNGERALRGLSRDVSQMSVAELATVRGIGKSIAAKVREYIDTGTIAKLDELRVKHPPGTLELRRVPGLGPKTITLLREVLGVTDLASLTAALDDGRLRELPGLGEKVEDNLRRAIQRLDLSAAEQRTPIAIALPIAERLAARLSDLPEVGRVEIAGSLRRFRDTIGDVDILAESDDAAAVMAAFVAAPEVDDVLGQGDTKTSIVTRLGASVRLQVDLRVVPTAAFGAAQVYFTGSKAHNIRLRERAVRRGLTLNEYGLARLPEDDEAGTEDSPDAGKRRPPDDDAQRMDGATEEAVYAALGLSWIAPELREDDGEIEQAETRQLPDLVTVADLQGDLHDHSDWSGDGRATLEQMLDGAAARGLAYFALTDHAENLVINGLSRERMLAQRRLLRRLQERYPDMVLLHGSELNIGVDGTLDYDADFLAGFDWCVASVHSSFGRPAAQQTQRVVAAIRHPSVNAIGHLTGRRIGKRPGIELDLDVVFDAAAETGTALEINGNLDRLDASAEVVREGARRAVTFVVSTDAHSVPELDNARHGVSNARRGGLPREQVANTWETERFLDWVRSVRQA